MRIEYDIKLDFKDVLIRPKRSVLKSRSEVSLERLIRFKHAGIEWTGVPIIAANMDHTGTFAMAAALSKHNLLTAIDKFASFQDWKEFSKTHSASIPSIFVSIGIAEQDYEKAREIINLTQANMICLD